MKKAKFFCDACGTEVAREAKTCPNCGRFFTSVRCPRCGKTGTSSAFKEGCPVCGYFQPPGSEEPPVRAPVREAPGPLPFWVLFIAVIGAAAVVIGIIWFLRPSA